MHSAVPGLSGQTTPKALPPAPVPTMLCAPSQPGRHWSPICRQVKFDSWGLWERIDPACSTISQDSHGRKIKAAFCYLCRGKKQNQPNKKCWEELGKDGERFPWWNAKTKEVKRSRGIRLRDVRRTIIANAICEKGTKSEGTLRCRLSAEG